MSLKTDDTFEEKVPLPDKVVANPILMPPPLPLLSLKSRKLCVFYHLPINVPKVTTVHRGILLNQYLYSSIRETNVLSGKGFDHCSVSICDVTCSVTKNTDTDEYTRRLVQQQLATKIYTKPNTRITPKKCAEDFGITITKSIQRKAPGLKFNKKHFIQKRTTVDEVDLHFLEQPLRCSTPTDSVDGLTILAGNLDVTLDDVKSAIAETNQMEVDLPYTTDFDEDDEEMFNNLLKRPKKNYCKMKKK